MAPELSIRPLIAAPLPGGTFTEDRFAYLAQKTGMLATLKRTAIERGCDDGFLENFSAMEVSAGEYAKKLTAANGSERDRSAAVAQQSTADLGTSEAAGLFEIPPRGERDAAGQGRL